MLSKNKCFQLKKKPQNCQEYRGILSQSFQNRCFRNLFLVLSAIALAITMHNIAIFGTLSIYDLIFLIICVVFAVIVTFETKYLLPLCLISLTILLSLYDIELFELFYQEKTQENNENFRLIRERIILLVQICFLHYDYSLLNIVNFLINIFLLFLWKFQGFRDHNNEFDVSALFFAIFYVILYFYVVIKVKFLQIIHDFSYQRAKNSNTYLNFLKKYLKKHCKTPIIIVSLGQSPAFAPINTAKFLKSKQFHTKLSIINDLQEKAPDDFPLNLEFINEEARALFQIASFEDLDRVLKQSIVFIERQDTSENSSLTRKIGDLKDECYKILNRYQAISLRPKGLEIQLLLDMEYKLKEMQENSHFLVHCSPFEHMGHMKLMLVFEDVTFKAEIQRLKAMDVYKDSILANVTHDLRAPLQGIVGCLEVLRQKTLNEQEITLFEMANSNVQMMSGLIQDILDDNQIRMGKFKLNFSEFDTGNFVKETASFIEILAKKHCVKVISKVANNIPRTVFSDPLRLKQVLMNLMNNSLKFTPKHGVVSLEVEVQPKKPGYLYFSVKDTGCGMPQETIDKLFRPYASFEGKGGTNKEGIGLGLTICQNIVSLLGPYNRIFCKSKLDKGTEFSFYIFTEKAQFDNININRNRSTFDENLLKPSNPNLLSLYSVFKIPGILNSENSRLIKSEEASINEELEYESEKIKGFGLDSEALVNSPSSNLSKQKEILKLVDLELGNQRNYNHIDDFDNYEVIKLKKSANYNENIVENNENSNENYDEIPTLFKKAEVSPPIRKKSLKKKSISALKPKTYDLLPSCKGLRNRRQFSLTKKSPRNRASLFHKESQILKPLNSNKKTLLTDSSTVSHANPGKILVIDDDFCCRESLKLMLNHLSKDWEIVCFDNATEALEKIESSLDKIAMIFTDLTMFGLSGSEFAQKLRAKDAKIPIIGVTGAEPTEELLQIFDKLLTKPVKMEGLREIAQVFLGK